MKHVGNTAEPRHYLFGPSMVAAVGYAAAQKFDRFSFVAKARNLNGAPPDSVLVLMDGAAGMADYEAVLAQARQAKLTIKEQNTK